MSPGSEHSNNRWYREFRPRFLEDRDPVETESINRQDDIEPWQDENDWLCTVEFLPSDDLPGRVFAGDIVGYLLGYAQLANARTLAIVGDPEAGAYELLFSCLPDLNKRFAFGVDFHQRTSESCRTENQPATSDRITVERAFLE